MDLLENLKTSLLNFSFIMIHKILALLKNYLYFFQGRFYFSSLALKCAQDSFVF